MGRQCPAPDVRLSAKSGVRVDPAGICDLCRRARSVRNAARAGLSRRAVAVRRHWRRGACRRPAQAVQEQSRSSGSGLRRRTVALVAASELFLRMVRLARLSADRDLAGLPVGLGEPARASLHVLDPGLCHRYPASGSPEAAFARRALPRLPVANEYLFPRAAAFERCGMTGGPVLLV